MIPCKSFQQNNDFFIKKKGFVILRFYGINEVTKDKLLISFVYFKWHKAYNLLIQIENLHLVEENKKLKEID